MEMLGTRVRMTVFRKLSGLLYLTSYSHRGKYYTLRTLCRFDDSGLWSYREAWFSRHGTLQETCKQFVYCSEAGFTAAELDRTLHVDTKQALLHLHQQQSLHREKFNRIFVHLSRSERDRQRRRAARGAMPALPGCWASIRRRWPGVAGNCWLAVSGAFANFHVNTEHPFEPLHPCHRPMALLKALVESIVIG